MASIFDYFNGSATPEQQSGLLGLAAAFNGALGDGSRPVNFGQALAAGAQGMKQGRMDYAEHQRAKQMLEMQAKLMSYKMKDAESDLQNQEQTRTDTKAAQDWMRQYGVGGGAAGSPGAIPPGGNSPAPTPGASVPGATPNAFTQRMAQAQAMRASGNPILMAQADKLEETALKFKPQVKDWKQVQVNGQVLYAPLFEDGTPGTPVPYEAAVELSRADVGGTTELYNPITGKSARSIQNTVSPDAALSASVSRENSIRTDSRARDFNAITAEGNAIKRGEKQREADLGKAGQIASFDTMLGTLGRLQSHPGLARSTGLYSKAPTIPGSDSANFQSELETFKAQAFIPMVAQLKGAGALSDAEGKKLSDAVGALNPNMSESAFRASLDRVVKQMDSARKLVVGSASPTLQQSLGAGSQPAPTPAAATPRAPMKGQVVDGYRFKGGNPADPNSWERK